MFLDKIFKEREIKRSHIRNLVTIMKLDNKVSKDELKFLFNIGKKVGVSKNDINTMIERTQKIEIHKPETIELTLDYIYDLILMANADGRVNEDEIALIVSLSEKLGLNPITSGIIVRQIIMMVSIDKSKKTIIDKLKSHLLV